VPHPGGWFFSRMTRSSRKLSTVDVGDRDACVERLAAASPHAKDDHLRDALTGFFLFCCGRRIKEA
jgi:hypothetical protein